MDLPLGAKELPFVSFYFDLSDPFSYVLWGRIAPLWSEHNVCMALEPVQLPLAGRTAYEKDDAAWQTVALLAESLHRPIERPTAAIGNGERATRVCLGVRDRSGQEAMQAFVDALWHRVWIEGKSMDAEQTLTDVCKAVSLPAELVTDSNEAIAAYARSIAERATEHGVNTIPAVVWDSEVYLGPERVLQAEDDLRCHRLRSR